MRLLKNILKRVIICAVLIVLLSTTALADSYIYNYKGEPIATPEAVAVKTYVDSAYAGWGRLSAPEDMDISDKGEVIIADTGNNRLVLLDNEYKFIQGYTEFKREDGTTTTLNAPKGVHYSQNGWLYVADSGNNRVLVMDDQFTILQEMKATDEEVLKDNFIFKPIKVAADKAGRTFIIADGVYDGLMEFDPNGTFLGFSGASKVKPNVIDLFWNWIGTEAQRKQRLKNVPTEFNNLDIDNEGFVYTVTTSVDQWNPSISEPIRKQTAMGLNIIRYSQVLGMPIGDLVFPFLTEMVDVRGPSKLIDISSKEAYGYAGLDVQRGRIFVYNNDGEMMFAFGGMGTTKGVFILPTAIVCRNNDIAVLDRTLGTITVFTFSDYAKMIISAQENYLAGRYDQSANDWNEVLKINSNLDMAYTGLGKIDIRQGNYERAIEYLQYGGNKTYYSKAFKYYREEIMNRNFVWIVFAVALVILLISLYIKLWRKKFIRREGFKKYAWYRGLKYGLHIITHPFDGFWDMTHEKRGNMVSAIILYGLFTLTMVLRSAFSGFLLKPLDDRFNLLAVLLSAIIPVVLWCLCNWCITTLFNGDGKFSTIIMAVAYVLMPYILINIPIIILSNFVTLDDSSLLYVFEGASIAWCAFLMFAAMLTIHDYTPIQTISTMILTVVGMAAVLFLVVLLVSLVQQLIIFLISMYSEIVIRL